MIGALLVLAVLAAAVCWLCASPARLAVAGGAVLTAHPAPTLAVTVVVAAGLTVAAVVLVARSVRDQGWSLVTVHRPTPNPVPAAASVGVPVGGVAP
ncbi:hypothetical protein E1264_35195 [Actinomadura sp. KC216]|uniref:hypothetical protein n=1 Tax=Actinomadura sp. KC216 TaxID=2530370 RepID=UPI00104AADFB|nr:hypothetical protein [Actinomadura sp. KC216]TDB79672.1 hypothetical protein E1264_35195 [Actinomadura sp. KC216]